MQNDAGARGLDELSAEAASPFGRAPQHCTTGRKDGAVPLLGALVGPRAGNEFGTILLAQLPALRRYAVALAGSLTQADDLVQDTIERALKQAEQLKEIERLGGWLRSILYHLYIDELRRRRARGIEKDITELADDFSLSTQPADRSSVNEFARALDTLSSEHRQILLLVGLQEMNYREVAEELHIPMGTVMSRLARAREKLRNAMEQPRSAEITPFPGGRRAAP